MDRRYKFDDSGLDRLKAIRQPGQIFSAAQIAAECGVSRQNVERIEFEALRKMEIRINAIFSKDDIQELRGH